MFVLVLGVTFFVTKWMGTYQKNQGRGVNIEIIDSARISPGVCIEIVRIGNRYVALSVGKDEAALVCELNEDDITLLKDSGRQGVGFDGVLKKVRDGMRNHDDIAQAESHQDEEESL